MHGIKKEKKTDAEVEAKQNEREKKIAAYSKIRQVLFTKAEAGIFDEGTLELSAKLLEKNPDIYTLWNFRRKAITNLASKRGQQSQEAKPTSLGEGDAIDELVSPVSVRDLFVADLQLTENCLSQNPKSYGAWHHRAWTLLRMPEPDFQSEIKLCDKALLLDERNFHCWDHRRTVCRAADVAAESELRFSTEKLNNNFSNYSAWHYRSKLLPLVHPDATQRLSVDASVVISELEKAMNAFYTDPDDSAAWFYTRWLLGNDSDHTRNDQDARLLAVAVDGGAGRIAVTFDRPLISLPDAFEVKTADAVLNGKWSVTDPLSTCSHVWTFQSDVTITKSSIVSVGTKSAIREVTPNSNELRSAVFVGDAASVDPALRSALQKQLESCLELHREEPTNKWSLFVATLCMQRLDPIGSAEQIVGNYRKLSEIDCKRRGFYQDSASEFLVRSRVCGGGDLVGDLKLNRLQLSNLSYTSLMIGVTELNISENGLTSLEGLRVMQNLKFLDASGNRLACLDGVESLRNLEELFVSENPLTSAKHVTEKVLQCKRLTKFLLCECPLCFVEEELKQLMLSFSQHNKQCRVFPFFLY